MLQSFGPPLAIGLACLVFSWFVVRLAAPRTPGRLALQVGVTCLVLTSLSVLVSQSSGVTIVTGLGSAVVVYGILRLALRRSLRPAEEEVATFSLGEALAEDREGRQRDDAGAGPSPGSPPSLEAPPTPGPQPIFGPLEPQGPVPLSERPPLSARPGAPGPPPLPEPSPGMRAAGILLLINGGLVFLFAGLSGAGPDRPWAGHPGATFLVDIVLGLGLLKGRRFWKLWATGRAVISAFIFGIMAAASEGTGSSWAYGAFQILFSVAFVYLLHLEGGERRKIATAVGAIVLAWGGVFATGVVKAIVAAVASRPAPTRAPDHAFVDQALGVRLDLPAGWVLLPASSASSSGPQVTMLAIHSRSSTNAMLTVEPAGAGPATGPGAGSLDGYLSRALQSRRSDLPSIVELGRESVRLADRDAVRMRARWKGKDGTMDGFFTVCRDGSSYYLLWASCPETSARQGFRAYQDLCGALRIAREDSGQPDAIAARLADQIPCISMRGARLLVEETVRPHLTPQEAARSGYETVRRGFALLRPPERAEVERLMSAGAATLPPQDSTRWQAYQRRLSAGAGLPPWEGGDALRLMRSALAGLSEASRKRLQRLGDKAIETALKRAQEAERAQLPGRAQVPGRREGAGRTPARR